MCLHGKLSRNQDDICQAINALLNWGPQTPKVPRGPQGLEEILWACTFLKKKKR